MMEPMHELLQEAKKGGYGIPAPNVYNRFTIEAALQAADELNAPVSLASRKSASSLVTTSASIRAFRLP